MKESLKRSLQSRDDKQLLTNLRMHYTVLLPSPQVLTKKFLEYAYRMGVILSRILDVSVVHSLLERLQVGNKEIQKEITAFIENTI